MKFPELVEWVGKALQDLDGSLHEQGRVAHLNRLYATLTSHGVQAEHWRDWHALARKVAKLIGQPPPAAPEVEPSRPSGKSRRTGRNRVRAGVVTPAKKKISRRAKVPRPDRYEVSTPVRQALDAIASGQELLFVTGRAGTGKSTFIQILRNELATKNIVVLAPTGIAALNAGGQTIHSFFRFPPKLLDPREVIKHDETEVFEKIEILVIDEVSMVRADVLDAVDASLRLNRKSPRLFGGVQVVLVGDLFQLPPVPPRGDDALAVRDRYRSFQFFGANCLHGAKMTSIELTHVYRQADQAFVSLLGDLRIGRNVAAACAELNRQCANRRPDGPHLVLVPRNDAADRENACRIAELPGRPMTYTATIEGQFRERDDDRLPAPRELTLKPQAQVMFTKNDAERRWVNGTTGVVTRLSKGTIEVRLEKGDVHEVERERWENVRYEFDREEDRIIPEVIGAYEQYPLMPAWAVTIHKAQGLTLSRVHVDFGPGAFAEGQAYVALSRCRRLADLSLARPLRTYDIKASSEIAEFYASVAFAAASSDVSEKAQVNESATWPMVIASWSIGRVPGSTPARVVATLVAKRVDVAVLLEVSLDGEMRELLGDAGYAHVTVREGSCPVAIASRSPCELMDGNEWFGEGIEGLSVIRIGGITLIAACFPRGEAKARPWNALLALASRSLQVPMLLAGDLKTGAHKIDETGETMICADRFARMTELGWIDVWRSRHPESFEWSWISPRGKVFRIDHALASPALAHRVVSCEYSHDEREDGVSEHSMLMLEVGA